MHRKRRLESSVLTASIIPQLNVTTLDAGDVLEVYYLTRSTELAEPLRIPITKASLGLRYRTSFQQQIKKLELTLELGPRRTESGRESIPIVADPSPGSPETAPTVIWDNQANIYFNERIEGYESAHYLASISGTVVPRLLWSVLAYAKARRFQPWQVVDANSTKLLLKSSADHDFLHYAYTVLADMGVELNPVIIPGTTVIQLHAVSIRKEQGIEGDAALFYRDLQHCLAQIATGSTDDSPNSTLVTAAPTNAPSGLLRRVFAVPEDVEPKTPSPTATNITTASPTTTPTSLMSNKQQEEAAQAANEAQQAADTAASANSTKSAQEAAVNAASAAQKAASVTASATANMAKSALFSNDAVTVTRTARSCMGTSPTAYIYIDGTFWYAVQLAAPFLSAVTRMPEQLPQPPNSMGESTTDVVDWALALLVLVLGSVGMLLLIQQVLGKRLLLYKYQRKFFQPTHPDIDTDNFDLSERDVGPRYSFGQDVIPLSMGGLRIEDGDEIELREFGRSLSISSDADLNDRLFRDPDMVDLPNLTTSRSKVAVPVSHHSNHSS